MLFRGTARALHVVGLTARRAPVSKRIALAGGAISFGIAYFADEKLGVHHHLDLLRARLIVQNETAPKSDDRVAGASSFKVDPDTEVRFPVSFIPTSPCPPLHLVGLGVRKVSFLRVKVYSAGFYIEESRIKNLHHVPGWHNFTALHLLTPPSPSGSDPLGAPQMTGEALIKSLLDQSVSCAVRIVPVRSTDFSHLRDGFTRALIARQKLARTSGSITETEDARITESIQSLKSLFPSQKVPKGHSLSLVRTKGSLAVEYEGRPLGEVKDAWLAREMMLAYFADKDVISPKLKEDVAQGFEDLMK
ncbi:chalcone-flavanone isomerase-domain-containing protein [Kockovaella imperatae]|uniref:Chalcone-flavanone isomerase-domain-containing protein n=1 Tax=Kockovaella imperatae TaxID=4999 RepID=A0A1Y1ULN8_9TREE|nr:chalcone-flavanone isomerase-domain-containing protein [Kockovaella imperatae]ORX38909.1 chalcone-flavanone isomerase-domain-containing protein [Kockovaella imperatae]